MYRYNEFFSSFYKILPKSNVVLDKMKFCISFVYCLQRSLKPWNGGIKKYTRDISLPAFSWHRKCLYSLFSSFRSRSVENSPKAKRSRTHSPSSTCGGGGPSRGGTSTRPSSSRDSTSTFFGHFSARRSFDTDAIHTTGLLEMLSCFPSFLSCL